MILYVVADVSTQSAGKDVTIYSSPSSPDMQSEINIKLIVSTATSFPITAAI